MKADHRSFDNISPQQFEILLEELRGRGFSPLGNPAGAIRFKGVHAEYRYDRRSRTIEVRLLAKPALVPSSLIWSAIEHAAKKYRASSDSDAEALPGSDSR